MSCSRAINKSRTGEREPLLPRYEGETSLQKTTQQQMHIYQMIRALYRGFMPSTNQLSVHLRVLLNSDLLNPETPGLSQSGKELFELSRQWLSEFIDLIEKKNPGDQIQDIISSLSHAKISVGTDNLVRSVKDIKVNADTSAVYESMKTIGNLLLTNSDFRMFLADLKNIGRQVFADTAKSVSQVSNDVALKVDPDSTAKDKIASRTSNEENQSPALADDFRAEASEIGTVVTDGIKKTGLDAKTSMQENISGDQRKILITRLKSAITKLRKRNDYSDSVNTISLLIQRYAQVYSQAADKAASELHKDVKTNDALDLAIKRFWSVLSTFGDEQVWKELEARVENVLRHSQKDPEFEKLMFKVSESVKQVLTDPNSFEAANNKFSELKEKSQEIGADTAIKEDIKALLTQTFAACESVVNDKDVSRLLETTLRIYEILSPTDYFINQDLVVDAYSIFIPLIVQSFEYIPIPRLELSVPEMDLLLENIIFQPGRTINHSSFLPFSLNVKTFNELTLRKARFRNVAVLKTSVTIKLHGISFSAADVGFWLRVHRGIFRFADEGLVSFELDKRGLDLELDVEIGKDRLENIISLKEVRVKVHKLSYTLRKSKFACIAWLFKLILRPLLRKVLERQIATSVRNFFHTTNRELLFARERLRATRIADPGSLQKFLKAVLTRLKPREDPEVQVDIGIRGGAGNQSSVFAGRYAPGSVVKIWDEEGARAVKAVDEHATASGWRNSIFDVGVTHP
ncbi:hypothetical protein K3495_g9020 [Podosphaera aphanis]|nr:hypothetical protein K3495_g9020 [Podosphaera aphanis]